MIKNYLFDRQVFPIVNFYVFQVKTISNTLMAHLFLYKVLPVLCRDSEFRALTRNQAFGLVIEVFFLDQNILNYLLH